jgi:hypothetical protein
MDLDNTRRYASISVLKKIYIKRFFFIQLEKKNKREREANIDRQI